MGLTVGICCRPTFSRPNFEVMVTILTRIHGAATSTSSTCGTSMSSVGVRLQDQMQ